MFKQPPSAPTASAVSPCPTLIQISRSPRHWKFTQHHRTTRPPPTRICVDLEVDLVIKGSIDKQRFKLYAKFKRNMFISMSLNFGQLQHLESANLKVKDLSTHIGCTDYTHNVYSIGNRGADQRKDERASELTERQKLYTIDFRYFDFDYLE